MLQVHYDEEMVVRLGGHSEWQASKRDNDCFMPRTCRSHTIEQHSLRICLLAEDTKIDAQRLARAVPSEMRSTATGDTESLWDHDAG